MQGPLIWSIVFAFGAGQTLVMGSALLATPERNRAATLSAGLLCLVIAASMGEEAIDAARLYGSFPWAIGATVNFELLVGPLVYLFARAVAGRSTGLDPRDLLHAAPFLISVALLIPFYGLSGIERLSLLNGDLPANLRFVFLLKPLHFATYVGLTLWHLTSRRGRESWAIEESDRTVTLLRWGVCAMAAIMGASVLLRVLSLYGVSISLDSDRFSSLLLATAACGITFLALRRPGVPPQQMQDEGSKYSTSPLSESMKSSWADRLVAHMEADMPYLDLDCRLESLAQGVSLQPHHLSQVLNEVVGQNFHEFVGRYRVRHAQALIDDPSNNNQTLLALSLASGFKSKASFNRAFKNYVGLTPSQYRNRRD